jgi:hypothetical protein
MYAHVTTYRLGSTAETYDDIAHCWDRGEVVTDQTARTIASWYMSPSKGSESLTALAHGLPFDTDDLLSEVRREVTNPDDREALLAWTYNVEDLLHGEAS